MKQGAAIWLAYLSSPPITCCLGVADKKQCFIASQAPSTGYLKAFITVGNKPPCRAEQWHALRVLEVIGKFMYPSEVDGHLIHLYAEVYFLTANYKWGTDHWGHCECLAFDSTVHWCSTSKKSARVAYCVFPNFMWADFLVVCM